MADREEENMNVHYKRDLNSNYMILTDDYPGEESYEVRMITENRIAGFLPCVCQQHEEKKEYYYEITGRQNMNLLYERISLINHVINVFLYSSYRFLRHH